MHVLLVGGEGFVGSAYRRLLERKGISHQLVTRGNWDSLRGQSCDVLINANGNSKKFVASREPLTDFDANVRTTCRMLEDFKAERFVLLSSGDVYPDPSSTGATREDQIIDPARQSRYGLHKKLAEDLVRGAHANWLVVRMGGFVGEGLKKNAIFDLMNGDPVWLARDSELQFIGTDTAASAIWTLIEREVSNEIVNMGARGRQSLNALHARLQSGSAFKEGAPKVIYELDITKLERLTGTPMPQSTAEVEAFLQSAGR